MKSRLAILTSLTGTPPVHDGNFLAYHVGIAVEPFASGLLAPPRQDYSQRQNIESSPTSLDFQAVFAGRGRAGFSLW